MADPGQLEIRGGSGGVSAHLEDVARIGHELQSLAGQLADRGRVVLAVAVDPGGAAGALTSPVTYAQARAALAGAVLGPAGLLAEAARVELLGTGALAVAQGYRAADAAAAGALQGMAGFAGSVLGGVLGPGLLAPVAAGVLTVAVIAGQDGNDAGLDGDGLPEPLTRLGGLTLRLLADHGGVSEVIVGVVPGLVRGVVGSVPGGAIVSRALFGRLAGPASLPEVVTGVSVAGGLAGSVAGGRPWFRDRARVRVRAVPVPWSRPASGAGELVARIPPSSPGEATVHVERIDSAAGRRWVVSVPGTSDWAPVAGPSPLDLTGDLRLMAGERSAGMAGVVEAMRVTGVRPGEPVLLVGHSQGGLVAAALAADPDVRRRFTVSSVLTSGAPVASIPVPDDVQVLSLEHSDDLVPRLDGRANADRPNWITVTAPAPVEGLPAVDRAEPLIAHRGGLYQRTAERLDASTDPTIQGWRAGISPFLAGPGVSGAAWDVEISRLP